MVKNKIYNISNFYTLLWCIYYFLGATTTDGSLLGQISLFAVLSISLCCMFQCLANFKLPLFFKALHFLLIMFTIYGIYRLIPGTEIFLGKVAVPRHEYLKNILISLLPIYTYYYFTIKGYITEEWFRRWLWVFVGIAIYSFFCYSLKLFSTEIEIDEVSDFDFTNNTAYIFVSILPVLVFYRRYPYIQYLLFFLISTFILFALKRGAIIILLICLLFYFKKTKLNISARTKFYYTFFVLLLVIIGIIGLYFFINNNNYIIERYNETISGDSSGRDMLFSKLIAYFFGQVSIISDHANLLTFLLGNGANATITIAGKNAHNDWLEILINQGLVGGLLFAYFWYVFFRTCKIAYNSGKPDEIGLALIIIFIICITKTFFSMSINDMNIYITSVLGYCLCRMHKRSNELSSV